MRPNVAVVLAGGVGSRLGLDKPKQFFRVAGRLVVEHTIDAFERNAHIEEIVIVSNPNFVGEMQEIVARNSWTKVRNILPGGRERYDSSLAAIRAYEGRDVNLVFHDAVRPLVSQRIIDDVCTALQEHCAVGVAVPVTDTIIEVAGSTIRQIPDRTQLRRAQTPQAFRLATIAEAYRRALASPHFKTTDDCGVVVNHLPEVPVEVVEGEESNMKLTLPEDIALLEILFGRRAERQNA